MAFFPCALFLPLVAFAFSVKDIPNPRTTNQWSVDQAHVLMPEEKAQLEASLEGIHQATGAEVAVVTLPTIGEAVPKDIAVELFNTWKIGLRGKDNGLLLLLVTDQRRLEIETGYGLEGALPDARLAKIQREVMTPELKAGHAGQAFLKGLTRIGAAIEQRGDQPNTFRARMPEGFPFSLYFPFAFTILLNAISLLLIAFLLKENDPSALYRKLGKNFGFLFFWQVSCLFFPFEWAFFRYDFSAVWVGLGIGIAWLLGGQYFKNQWRKRARMTPRKCSECGKGMTLLSALQEKAFETAREQFEEKIGSVDYDVWICPEKHVQKIYFDGENSELYSLCKSCNTRAAKLVESTVLLQPTYYASGKGIKKLTCLACKAKSEVPYEIPMLVDSSSSSGGSSGSSGGGGSSFGGGSSGGGGSGSNY